MRSGKVQSTGEVFNYSLGKLLGVHPTGASGNQKNMIYYLCTVKTTIRATLQPGDLTYLLSSHQKHYALHHDYPSAFEYIVLKATQDLYEGLQRDDRTRLWVAEASVGNGGLVDRVGSIVLQDRGELAQLRLYFVEEAHRGAGVGRALLTGLLAYAKAEGFAGVYLWTTAEQTTAGALYRRNKFRLSEERVTQNFGLQQTEQRYLLSW